MALPVSDSLSNVDEQIEAAARVLGRSQQAHTVFNAIYYGKKKVKFVDDLTVNTGLSQKQVLTQGKKLADNHIVNQVKLDGKTGYEKIPFFYHNKKKILSLASNPNRLEAYPTKRKNGLATVITVKIEQSTSNIQRVHIDDISSFSKVRNLPPSDFLGEKLSERQFKEGIKAILGEKGKFTDWGGEKNDLYTTRMIVDRRRRSAAFAFKGPAKKGILTPAKMGKNADQIQRLFEVDADIFIVQYAYQIGESVIDQMEKMAIAKSVLSNRKIWYGTIDGIDSDRIFAAYRTSFPNSKGD